MIERHQVVQAFLDLYSSPAYLEVGVSAGVTFHALKASKKVAVDPKFVFDKQEREVAAKYHEVPSDEFFQTLPRSRDLFDVIYLDGLHTFEQTLRDLMNAIGVLKMDGIIIIDDVLPNSYHASLPSIAEFETVWKFTAKDKDTSWMGDVFKLVFFVQAFLPQFEYSCISDNHGQPVMWRGRRNRKIEQRSMKEVVELEFKDIFLQRNAYNFMTHAEIVSQVRSQFASRE